MPENHLVGGSILIQLRKSPSQECRRPPSSL